MILSSTFLAKTSIKSIQQECLLILLKLAATQKTTTIARRLRWPQGWEKTQNRLARLSKIQTPNTHSCQMRVSFIEGILMITISYSVRLTIIRWWKKSLKSAFLKSQWQAKISSSVLTYLAYDNNLKGHRFKHQMTTKRNSLRKPHQYRRI